MSIQHASIPDAQLHEPKGAVSALVNTVYTSNGVGAGTWSKVSSAALSGLVGDAGISGKKLITNGTNGFTLITDQAYGMQTITNNAVVFPLTAVADTTFNTPTQFTLLTGSGAPWLSEELFGMTFSVDRLTVPVTGVYRIDLWMNVLAFTGNTAKVSVRYRINGTGAFSTRKPTIKSAIANDVSQLSGFGYIPLVAGDFVQIYIASDTTGNLVIGDANSSLHLVRQTS